MSSIGLAKKFIWANPLHMSCFASFLNASEILGLNLSKQRYKQRSLSFLVCQMGIVSVYAREGCLISGDFSPSSKPYFLSDIMRKECSQVLQRLSLNRSE